MATKPTSTPTYKIFDGHNDVLLSLYLPERGKGRTFFTRSEQGHLDLPRAREGGFRGGFFAIFTPAYPPHSFEGHMTVTADGYAVEMESPLDQAFALKHTLGVLRLLFDLEAQSGGQLRVVRTADELDDCLATGSASDGPLAAVAHIEGAEAIDGSLDALYILHAAGLRSLGPVWSRPTIFGYGVPFRFPASPDTGPGLTDAGKRLVKACNELGVLIDLAHINEQGFWDVASLSDAPLVVTHTAAHALCPFTRNITDKQIDAVGASDGVVGVIYGV
ncbi:MAG TPA: membrane dipeptidase, partial [Ktedonobacterales bacterium]|nr:membrane dipeptidase [Ktedonobacterales bacterium]